MREIIPQFTYEALKAALYAHRKQMSKAQRRRKKKPVTNLYPWSTERRYAATILSWLNPLKIFVTEYLKNNLDTILRGDNSSPVRNDVLPGGSMRRMVATLDGWIAEYFPPIEERNRTRRAPPTVYIGLGNIAEAVSEFNSNQWAKIAKENIGIEFPVYESWWTDTKQLWADENYKLIKKLSNDYIAQINRLTERAVTNGWSPRHLAKEIQRAADGHIAKNRANLIARDQIGKLNGRVTQARMQAVGLSMYEWSTSFDERVRGNPAGIYPNARPSHYALEGMICKWSDSTVYSPNRGKSWKPRPASWCQLHPGIDIQCRCTALTFWDGLVNEVDNQINNENR